MNQKLASNTITGLKRWSCDNRELPPVARVKALHVYDFDNTLFKSPLPNPKLWQPQSVGFLQREDCFTGGGWWHDQHILEATGEGIEKEEPRAWEGWWNETIVDLVKLSIQQEDALAVLMTGRGERNFADIIKRIARSKKLAFDMICLKPMAGPNNERFKSTLIYKQAALRDLIFTYKDADEIRIYEDRPKQARGFREFLDSLNADLLSPSALIPRKPIKAEVIQVAEQDTSLNPVVEASEVQRMINAHNTEVKDGKMLKLKRSPVFSTGYLLSPSDTPKLLTLLALPSNMREQDVKFLANNVLISVGPAPPHILSKVGGIGTKQTWQVTGFGMYNFTVWAARVAPIPPISTIHTDHHVPYILLAHHKTVRASEANRIQNWQPVSADKQYVFQTTVGEKVQLRVEQESDDSEPDGTFEQSGRKNLKRRHSPFQQPQRNGHSNDENRRPNSMTGGPRGNGQLNRGRGGGGVGTGRGGGNSNSVRGGRGSGPGRGGGGNNRGGRGVGQRGGYKSLDDVGAGGARQRGEPNYDDYVPTGDGYKAAFPALESQGLPYGK